MKKTLLFITIIIALWACSEKETISYEGETYLYFATDMTKDSVETSFFFYPGAESIEIPVELNLGGRMLPEDTPIKLGVDTSLSNALAGNYLLPENPVFRANRVKDTIYITLVKSPELNNQRFRLVLSLQETPDYQLGPKIFRHNKTIFTSMASRPEWWTEKIAKVYLGEYSQHKYEEFMFETGVGDLTGMSSSEIRALALEFKRALKARPRIDRETGKLMEVTVIGE